MSMHVTNELNVMLIQLPIEWALPYNYDLYFESTIALKLLMSNGLHCSIKCSYPFIEYLVSDSVLVMCHVSPAASIRGED